MLRWLPQEQNLWLSTLRRVGAAHASRLPPSSRSLLTSTKTSGSSKSTLTRTRFVYTGTFVTGNEAMLPGNDRSAHVWQETAEECGVSSMPTFQFYRRSDKIDEFSVCLSSSWEERKDQEGIIRGKHLHGMPWGTSWSYMLLPFCRQKKSRAATAPQASSRLHDGRAARQRRAGPPLRRRPPSGLPDRRAARQKSRTATALQAA